MVESLHRVAGGGICALKQYNVLGNLQLDTACYKDEHVRRFLKVTKKML